MVAGHSRGPGLRLRDCSGAQILRPFHGSGRSFLFQASQFCLKPLSLGLSQLTSSPSPSSLFGAWNQSTQAPQRSSCFLRTALALSAWPGGCWLWRQGWRRGELPAKPRPPC